MKNPTIEQNFGAEVSTADMQDAINKIPGADPLRIQKGEYAYTETTTKIEDLAPATTAQRADTVTDRIEDADKVTYTIVTQLGEMVDGQMEVSESEDRQAAIKHPQSAARTTAPGNVGEMVSPVAAMKALDARLDKLDESAQKPPPRETYHNLHTDQITIPVPASVTAQADCGGIPMSQCRTPLSAFRVQFDKVRWGANNLGDRTGYSFTFSRDVPYFAHLMELCQEAHISFHGQRIHVFQCEQVRNFRFHQ